MTDDQGTGSAPEMPGAGPAAGAGQATQAPRPFGARRALAIFGAFLGAQLGVAFVAGLIAALGGVALESRLLLSAGAIGSVLAAWVVLRMIRRSFPGPLAAGSLSPVGWAPASARQCARAALLGLVPMFLLFIFRNHLPPPSQPLGPLASAAQAGGWARVAWAVLALAVAPPVEEFVFRGVLYTGLGRSWGPLWAGVAVTATFVALHVTETRSYWPAWIALALLGTFTLRVRVATGSLLPAIALHATYNLVLVLAAYAR
jgi:membrane protease YdiL (CAAX protease family)